MAPAFSQPSSAATAAAAASQGRGVFEEFVPPIRVARWFIFNLKKSQFG
jgi:hypothetical protein